jgi:class 3 adenylate cyclase
MTVTLDADVAARLKAVARERRISFKQALNTAVRAGLDAERRAGRGFKQYAQAMGLRSGLTLDKALQFAAALEDQAIVRRVERKK